MAFETKIDKLIEKLTDLTSRDKVAWQDTADENTFLTAVGQSVVTVGRARSDAMAPCFIRILDDTGKVIEEALDTDIQDWNRLRTLHELARRNALKSDKVVSDLLSSLEAIR
ncbi:MAG: hypothetical protein ABSF12_06275 [Bryobacteraceae bacterium]|jgi:hypothetical protein